MYQETLNIRQYCHECLPHRSGIQRLIKQGIYSLVAEGTAVSRLRSLMETLAIFWWCVARIKKPSISDSIVMNVSLIGAVYKDL